MSKFFVSILSILLYLPLQAKAFLNFCFPISFTILTFILGWPIMVFGELLPQRFTRSLFGSTNSDLSFTWLFIFGLIIDLLFVYLISYLLDKSNGFKTRYAKKIPLIFFLAIVVLFIFSYFDPTCYRG